MSTNPSESAKKAFQDALFVVRQEYKGVADGEQMLEKITAKLTETFDKPPREEFEQILRKRFSDDEVRIVVFRPNEEQVDYYPVLMSVLDEVPASHPAKKVQAIVITVVYLIHRFVGYLFYLCW